ncbi:MAG TPA: peptidoglycan recognition family protein [Blastocatellia bacterium]|nr:peptidoglycan recognition family protein [Blastocatellia bacterium]
MQEFLPQNLRYAKLVDRYSRYIDSPVLRLKFLNSALSVTPPHDRWKKLPLVGSLPDRAFIILELSKVLPLDQQVPLGIKVASLLYRIRYALYGLSLMTVVLACAGLVYGVSRIVSSVSVSTEAKDIVNSIQTAPSSKEGEAVAAIGSGAGLSLDKIWLAEKGEGYEFYSNGARVLTEFETEGSPRSFYKFDLEGLTENPGKEEILSRPVGIVYHLSESDLIPFANRNNSSLNHLSRELLEYAQQHRLYNYIIDRFGRTYRVVRDESAANHAGNSIWSDGHSVFVNLSASFVGVCFEGRGAAMGAEGINEAQIYAARVLTAVLRSKYGIDDSNCVTHGLVSVNPANRLMGYHTDWVSEFPFEALGLSNKYDAELVAISRLGFGYDQAYVNAAGGKWPGLERANATLQQTAEKNGFSLEKEKQLLSRVFGRIYSMQRSLER